MPVGIMWVSHMLIVNHVQCVACSRELFDSIVMVDETWCCHFTPEMDEISGPWFYTTSPRPLLHTASPEAKKSKQTQSAEKGMATVLFYNRKQVLLINFLDPRTIIN